VRTEPAHHVAGDFVADQETEKRGVTAVGAHGVFDGFFDSPADGAAIQELDMLGPRDRDKAAHAVIGAGVHEPRGWHVVNPQEVQSGIAHHRQIAFGAFRCAEVVALRIGGEWSVGDAFDEKLAVSLKEKFGLYADPGIFAHGA